MGECKIVGVYYYFLHKKLYKRFGEEVRLKEAYNHLGSWGIPKNIRPLIVRELELLKLVKKKNRVKLILKQPKFEGEEVGVFYKKLKIY